MAQAEKNATQPDALLAQIRGEIARLQQMTAAQNTAASDSSLSLTAGPPAPQYALPPRIQLPYMPGSAELPALEKKTEYDIREFLQYEDISFLNNVFRALLDRDPDGDGALYFMNMLRAGQLTKTDILVGLAQSEETRRRNIVVHGLRKQLIAKWFLNIPVLGKIIALFAAIWKLPGLINTVHRLSTQQAKMAHEIPSSMNALATQTETALQRHADFNYIQLRKQASYLQHHKASVRAVIQLMDDIAVLEERLRELSAQTQETTQPTPRI